VLAYLPEGTKNEQEEIENEPNYHTELANLSSFTILDVDDAMTCSVKMTNVPAGQTKHCDWRSLAVILPISQGKQEN